MSTFRLTVVVAVCAALGFLAYRVGNCQDLGEKGKQATEAKWADDPAPADHEGRRGHPGGPPTQGLPNEGDRNGPPPGGEGRMGPPGGPPMQGPPGAEGHAGAAPGPGGQSMGGPGMGGPQGWPHDRVEFLERSDPEMYKLVKADMDLDRQTRNLAMHYRQASSEQRPKLKEQLKDLVAKHFDVRQERRALELKRLEAELQRLREAMERRQKAREKLVEQRLSDLLDHEDEAAF